MPFSLQKFNTFLKDDKSNNPVPVVRILERVNEHLRTEGTRFMVTDELRRADCHLLPWLQHIRVAGKVCTTVYLRGALYGVFSVSFHWIWGV